MQRNDFLTHVNLNRSKGIVKPDKYIVTDHANSEPFSPVVKLKGKYSNNVPEGLGLPVDDLSSSSLTKWANDWCREIRLGQYRGKIRKGYKKIKIVSEGDSWFQYPCTLRDIIDKIKGNYAVLSLGAAGDTMSKMLEKSEYMDHLEKENAHVLLFSGGGNDVLGNGHLENMLKHYESSNPDRKPEDYLNDESDKVFKDIENNYRLLIERVSCISHRVDIFIHGYDYVLPNNGKYLGKPMASIDIVDPELQKAIVRVLIDKFNLILKNLSVEKEIVHHIDCRGAVPENKWYDEIHPNSHGFRPVAKRFKVELRKISPPSSNS